MIGQYSIKFLPFKTCRCDVTGGIENTFCADLQVKLGVRLRFLECMGLKSKPECMKLG